MRGREKQFECRQCGRRGKTTGAFRLYCEGCGRERKHARRSGPRRNYLAKLWREKNPESVRASLEKYLKLHRERVRACQKRSYKKHREKRRAHRRKYYLEHREKMLAYAREYRERNPGSTRAAREEWRRLNAERERVYRIKYYDEHYELRRAYNKYYYQKHREKRIADGRKYREERGLYCTKAAIAQRILDNLGLSVSGGSKQMRRAVILRTVQELGVQL